MRQQGQLLVRALYHHASDPLRISWHTYPPGATVTGFTHAAVSIQTLERAKAI